MTALHNQNLTINQQSKWQLNRMGKETFTHLSLSLFMLIKAFWLLTVRVEVKTPLSGSGCGAGQHASCQQVVLSVHEHCEHLILGQTYRHRLLWAFEKFG